MGLPFEELADVLRHTLPHLVLAADPEKWITVRHAAIILGCSDGHVRKLTRQGLVRFRERGRKINVLLKDVLDYQLGSDSDGTEASDE